MKTSLLKIRHFLLRKRRYTYAAWRYLGGVSLFLMLVSSCASAPKHPKKTLSLQLLPFLKAFPYTPQEPLSQREEDKRNSYQLGIRTFSDLEAMTHILKHTYHKNILVHRLQKRKKDVIGIRTLIDLEVIVGPEDTGKGGHHPAHTLIESLNVTDMSLLAQAAMATMFYMPHTDIREIQRMQAILRLLVQDSDLRETLIGAFEEFKENEKDVLQLSSTSHPVWDISYQWFVRQIYSLGTRLGASSVFKLELMKRIFFDTSLAILSFWIYATLVNLFITIEKIKKANGNTSIKSMQWFVLAISPFFFLYYIYMLFFSFISLYLVHSSILYSIAQLMHKQQKWLCTTREVYGIIHESALAPLCDDLLAHTKALLTNDTHDEKLKRLVYLLDLKNQDFSEFSLFFSSTGKLLQALGKYEDDHHKLHPAMYELGRMEAILNMAHYIVLASRNRNKVCFTSFVAQGSHANLLIDMKRFCNSAIDEREAVPNDILIDGNKHNANIIGGPNAGGKSSYLRGIGRNALLAQVYGISLAETATQSIFQHIITYLNIKDDVGKKLSQYTAELDRIETILQQLKDIGREKTCLVLIDEPVKGTNPTEASVVAFSFIDYMVRHYPHSAFFVISHLPLLDGLPKSNTRIVNYHVVIRRTKDDFSYTYKIAPGKSSERVGLDILKKRPNFPPHIREKARKRLRKKNRWW